MIADDIRRDMMLKHKGYWYNVLEVKSPNPPNNKAGTPKMCRFQLTTRPGHFGTTVQVEIPFDERVMAL